jgi:hypothetical protein
VRGASGERLAAAIARGGDGGVRLDSIVVARAVLVLCVMLVVRAMRVLVV